MGRLPAQGVAGTGFPRSVLPRSCCPLWSHRLCFSGESGTRETVGESRARCTVLTVVLAWPLLGWTGRGCLATAPRPLSVRNRLSCCTSVGLDKGDDVYPPLSFHTEWTLGSESPPVLPLSPSSHWSPAPAVPFPSVTARPQPAQSPGRLRHLPTCAYVSALAFCVSILLLSSNIPLSDCTSI